MVSKYYKIAINRQEITYLSLFSCIYIYVQPVFALFKVFNKQITTFENITPQRREVVVSGDGYYFYRAVALWKDKISDEKYEDIPRSSDSLCEKNPEVFELQLFFSNSLKDLVRKERSRELRERLIGRFYYIFHGFSHKLTLPLYQHYPNSFLIKERWKSDNLSKLSFFGRRNNLLLYISFKRVAMFSPWGSQIPVRKHKNPITGNSYIVTKMWRLKMCMVLGLVCGPYFSRPLTHWAPGVHRRHSKSSPRCANIDFFFIYCNLW